MYRPLVQLDSAVKDLSPNWKTCNLGFGWDPPIPLTPANSIMAVTTPHPASPTTTSTPPRETVHPTTGTSIPASNATPCITPSVNTPPATTPVPVSSPSSAGAADPSLSANPSNTQFDPPTPISVESVLPPDVGSVIMSVIAHRSLTDANGYHTDAPGDSVSHDPANSANSGVTSPWNPQDVSSTDNGDPTYPIATGSSADPPAGSDHPVYTPQTSGGVGNIIASIFHDMTSLRGGNPLIPTASGS